MLVKLLGLLDILAGGLILLLAARVPMPSILVLLAGIAIFAKSFLGLFKEIGGWIDLVCSLAIILASYFVLPRVLLILIGFLLFQKGIISFL